MILEDDNGVELQPYRVQSFDGETVAPEGQLVPAEAERPFDAPLTPEAEARQDDGFERETPEVETATGDTDFVSIKFQRENTLLTNAERYADSIRSEAELYVRQLQGEIEALNAEAERRYEEAAQVKAEAEAEAKRMIEAAEQRVEEVRAQAHGEGFEAGRRQGLEKRYEEAGVHLERLERILADLTHFREQVDHFMERDGIRLAVLVAKKILHQELKVNKQVVWKLLAATLAGMEGKGNFVVWLSPEDFRFATAARPALERFTQEEQTLTFRSRAGLPPGNAMIETDREVIDLSFASQFHHVESLLYRTLAEHEGNVLNRPSALRPPGPTAEQVPEDAGEAAQQAAGEPDAGPEAAPQAPAAPEQAGEPAPRADGAAAAEPPPGGETADPDSGESEAVPAQPETAREPGDG